MLFHHVFHHLFPVARPGAAQTILDSNWCEFGRLNTTNIIPQTSCLVTLDTTTPLSPQIARPSPLVGRYDGTGLVMQVTSSPIRLRPMWSRSSDTFWSHAVIFDAATQSPSEISWICHFGPIFGRGKRRSRYSITTPRAQTSPGEPRPVLVSSKNSGGRYQGVPPARVLSVLLSPKSM